MHGVFQHAIRDYYAGLERSLCGVIALIMRGYSAHYAGLERPLRGVRTLIMRGYSAHRASLMRPRGVIALIMRVF